MTSAYRNIGLLMQHSSAYGRQIFSGIRRATLTRLDWGCLVGEASLAGLRGWRELALDGVIAHVGQEALIAPLQDLGVPVVNVSSACPTPFDHVGLDNLAIGRLAAQHLLDRGHSRFAFIGHAPVDYVEERRQGFVDTLAAAGHDCRCLHWQRGDLVEVVDWLRAQPMPQAVLIPGEYQALRLILACRRAGLLVPEELAVLAGTDDEQTCTLTEPFLSAVELPAVQIGMRAVARLAQLLVEPIHPAVDERIAPQRVISRTSTDTDAVDDPQLAQAMALIRQRLTETLGVDEIADAVGLNRRTLERLFRARIGRSVYQHVLHTRLTLAKQLLATTDLPLRDIAVRVGFATAQHFADCFRRKEGRTPGSFRRLQATGDF